LQNLVYVQTPRPMRICYNDKHVGEIVDCYLEQD